jgi:hypothetical protein
MSHVFRNVVLIEFLRCLRRLRAMAMRLESAKQIGLSGPLLAFGFGLAPRLEPALLRREMWAGFQFVIFAGVAVEMEDFLLVHLVHLAMGNHVPVAISALRSHRHRKEKAGARRNAALTIWAGCCSRMAATCQCQERQETQPHHDHFRSSPCFRHAVWTLERALAARAFWTGDAEAPASLSLRCGLAHSDRAQPAAQIETCLFRSLCEGFLLSTGEPQTDGIFLTVGLGLSSQLLFHAYNVGPIDRHVNLLTLYRQYTYNGDTDKETTMDARQQRGLEIAATMSLEKQADGTCAFDNPVWPTLILRFGPPSGVL